jgi:capsular exopolysaccharide synthesis family protein
MRFIETLRKRRGEGSSQPRSADARQPESSGKSSSLGRIGVLHPREATFGAPSQDFATTSDRNSSQDVVNNISSNAESSSGVELLTQSTIFRKHIIEETNANQRLVAITQPNSIYSEEYRRIRNRLLRSHKRQGLRTIVISSSIAGEGKSVTALNLALMLANTANLRVLIVDADMRNGRITDYLGIDGSIGGLSDVLSGQKPLSDVIFRIEPVGLFVLPAGASRNDLPELLVSDAFASLKDSLERAFDLIVIDTPPIGFFSDASVIIDASDALILIVGVNQVSGADIARIVRLVPQEKLIGLVLNRASETLARSGEYDSNYYYSDY